MASGGYEGIVVIWCFEGAASYGWSPGVYLVALMTWLLSLLCSFLDDYLRSLWLIWITVRFCKELYSSRRIVAYLFAPSWPNLTRSPN